LRRFSEPGPWTSNDLKGQLIPEIGQPNKIITERKISGKVLGGLYCCAKFGWLVLILRAFDLQTPTNASKITVLCHLSRYMGSIINNTTKEHIRPGETVNTTYDV